MAPNRASLQRVMAERVPLWVALALSAALPRPAMAAKPALSTYATLISRDGVGPQAALVEGTDGNFYGSTTGGGATESGTLFKLTPTGAITVLHSFDAHNAAGINQDGYAPIALVESGGVVFGAATAGGKTGKGTFFSVTPAGVFKVLYTFAAYGDVPTKLAAAAGDIYGISANGGTYGNGAFTRFTPQGVRTVLHSFGAGGMSPDGSSPGATLLPGGAGFYGFCASGGANGNGVVFQISTSGDVTPIYSFPNPNDADFVPNMPGTLALATDGNLYGATLEGGGADGYEGLVFQLSVSGTFKVIYNPGNNNGDISTLVAESNGNLFGDGFIGFFEITPAGAVNALPDPGGLGQDEGFNQDFIVGSDGDIYGSAQLGGTADQGFIFRLSGSGTSAILKNFFYDVRDVTKLLSAPDGNLYGLSGYGQFGNGTVFKIAPDGKVSTLYNFGALTYNDALEVEVNASGVNPTELVLGADGALYGTTPYGGPAGRGTFFRLTTKGDFRVVEAAGKLGFTPKFLTLDKDGDFFGAQTPEDNFASSIYRLAPGGGAKILHEFGPVSGNGINADGYLPQALTLADNGDFYGTTLDGGPAGGGTIFRIKPGGAFGLLHKFPMGSENQYGFGQLASPLTLGPSGDLYGTTESAGANKTASIFRVKPAGGFKTLVSIPRPENSGSPFLSALIADSDGKFYGTEAGPNILFSVTPAGKLTTAATFPTIATGTSISVLCAAEDGSLFGQELAASGDLQDRIFRYTPATAAGELSAP